MATLSILMPVYNCEAYVEGAIRSIIKQTYSDWELLICDDGSADNSWEVIQRFDDTRIQVFRNAVNFGKNRTCDFLLSKIKGEFVSVHDADDISRPTRFESQMAFLTSNPQYAMCGTNFISFLNSGKVVGKSSLHTSDTTIRELIVRESQFHGPTLVIRRSILTEVGGFYRHFTRGEDIDLTMRITEKFKVANLATHLYYYRHQPNSLTNNISGYSLERLAEFRLIYHLAGERLSNDGIDSLMRGNQMEIQRLLNDVRKEFKDDADIALRRGVFRLLCMQMYMNAIVLSWRVVIRNQSMLNIKCLIFALLKSSVGGIKLLFSGEKIDLEFLK